MHCEGHWTPCQTDSLEDGVTSYLMQVLAVRPGGAALAAFLKLNAVWKALEALLVMLGEEVCSKEQTAFSPALHVAIPRQMTRLHSWHAGGWAAGSMRAGP